MIERIKEKLGDKIKEIKFHNEKRIYITVDKKDLKEVVNIIFNQLGARYQIVSGIENFDNFELLYHFSFDKENGIVVSFRTFLDKEKPEIESLTSIIPGISYIEREIWELLGINFIGHPNLKHFLLREDWQENLYPLRKGVKKDGRE
ncbi:MAG: NADH-quinone oxidoreductase subunit C [Candidatus Omnitrophica bacterium]|nr:NADH-quinone oxidoreductase subunit C [Candidatus Omnitrophota bacterium]MCM8808735.1 NADH-quinone oxidoreductase subunit C [Candidatus Omnitrophota bacterium]MCM8810211.1 NADH-quinone oxidoreductase subunit C [Candidatus Omnitrophota bacterium]